MLRQASGGAPHPDRRSQHAHSRHLSCRAAARRVSRAGRRHWIETLSDGSHVLVRPIRPEDRERESDFIARLSPAARHFRFLGEIREASPALLDQLVNVDFS